LKERKGGKREGLLNLDRGLGIRKGVKTDIFGKGGRRERAWGLNAMSEQEGKEAKNRKRSL